MYRTAFLLALALFVSIPTALVLFLSSPTATAQSDPGEAPLETVRSLFDAMSEADTSAMRALFVPGASLRTVVEKPEGAELHAADVDQFMQSIGSIGAGRVKELTYDEHADVDGPLAMVWAPYTLYLDGELHHCGTNSFQLAEIDGQWKIVANTDTYRTGSCEER